jgi:RNA recognition motif-containing protein
MEIDSFCPVGIGGTRQLDTTKLKLFVGNLPLEFRSKEVFSVFSKYGTIREAVVIPDRFRIRSRCYGFVTFVNEESVEKIFDSMPIEVEGRRLTIILACKNAKPRRAHFNVRHGTSGHRALPPTTNGVCIGTKVYSGNDKCQNKSESNDGNRNEGNTNSNVPKKYNDPSLFRTANIQSITPACIQTGDENLSSSEARKLAAKEIKREFPNEDIEKDFERLLQINENKENKNKNETNKILDCIQVKKETKNIDNQSKDKNLTPTNQKISMRWQFIFGNDDENNNLHKKHPNNKNYNFNNEGNYDNYNMYKKTINDNVTWNRNMVNNRNNRLDEQNIVSQDNEIHESKRAIGENKCLTNVNNMNKNPTIDPIFVSLNHLSQYKNSSHNMSKGNNVEQTLVFTNNYSQYLPSGSFLTNITR